MPNMASRDAATGRPEGFETLMEKASLGDATAVTALKKHWPECQDALVRTYGDLAGRTQEALIAAHAGEDMLESEALRMQMEQLKSDLTSKQMSPVETILIERNACNWLNASLCDLAVAQYTGEYHHRTRLQKLQSEAERTVSCLSRTNADPETIIAGGQRTARR